MTPKIKDQSIQLNNGKWMPLVGIGCWMGSGNSRVREVGVAVEEALCCGYKHIDTAYNYQNEDYVKDGIDGWMLRAGGKRKDIFVVTKLPGIAMRAGLVEKFLQKSLASLGVDNVDLYLIHSPIGFKGKDDNDTFPLNSNGTFNLDEGTDLIAIWKAMEKMVDLGLTKSIGLSNFSVKQMKKIMANARIKPAVNQVEMNVHFQQQPLVKYCNENDIVVTAFAPLGSPGRQSRKHDDPKVLDDPVVKIVADIHKVTAAQVLLRYLVQQGVVVIPKSLNKERIKQNLDIFSFELTSLEMEALKSIDQNNRQFDFNTFCGAGEHPECDM